MMIHSYENGKRAKACIEYLRGLECARDIENIVLLPIPSTRDNRTVSNTNIYINEVLGEVERGTLVVGYSLPPDFADTVRAKGGYILDLFSDEDFLLENADLTALCTIGVLLTTAERSPRDLSVGVVGYGRIGKRLTNLLLYLGAKVRVFTTRENTRIDLCEYGVSTSPSESGADLSGIDILINTAPAVIFAREDIPESLRVIDLASGNSFPWRDVERYPSVPAKMLPISAGKAWGRAIERFIVNNT